MLATLLFLMYNKKVFELNKTRVLFEDNAILIIKDGNRLLIALLQSFLGIQTLRLEDLRIILTRFPEVMTAEKET